MNRFRFRFESLLKVRKAEEEVKKREFGVVLGHLKHEEDQFNRINDSIASHDEYRENATEGKVTTPRKLSHDFQYSQRLEREKSEQEKTLDSVQEVVEEKRKDLVEATKKKKIFDRLREKDKAEHDQAELKEEQALIDELSTERFNNKNYE